MKKLIVILTCFNLLPITGYAGFGLGSSTACAVDPDGGTDWFWYCGSQSRDCNGTNDNDKDRRVWLISATDVFTEPTSGQLVQGNPGDYSDWAYWAFYWEGSYYACCGGTTGQAGQLRRYYSGSFLTETTKEVGGGTCTDYVNPCGTTFDKDGNILPTGCTEPDTCPDGQLIGKIGEEAHCICPNGQGFNGEYSSECVTCKITHSQGIDKNGVCVTCSSDEFFKVDYKVAGETCSGQNCCIKKTSVQTFTRQGMQWCWRCPSSDRDLWKRCLNKKLGDATAGGLAEDWEKCGVATNEQNPY